MDKPTVQEIEEYMASLNIPLEQGLNGTTKADIQCATCKHCSNVSLCSFTGACSGYSAWESKTDTPYDVISKPKHYMLFEPSDIHPNKGIEVRDVLEVLAEKTADMMGAGKVEYSPLFISDYVQLMQYLMRFMDKNGVEDLKKARWYLDKMILSY
jgi:hypothetical protein